MNAPAIVADAEARGQRASAVGWSGGSNRGATCGNCARKRELSLAEVAKRVGISVGFLSAIERSQMSASVGTLRKLARYYKTNILDFFDASGSERSLVRPSRHAKCWRRSWRAHGVAGVGNTVMEPHLFRIAPNAGSGDPTPTKAKSFCT